MFRRSIFVAALTLTALTSANASVLIGTGNPGGPHENVQYNDDNPGGLSLVALTNQNTSVTFTGLENLQSFAGGQARISGTDGNLQYLQWQLTDPLLGYRVSAFIVTPTSSATTTLDITVTNQLGQVTFCDNCVIDSSGFFNVVATGTDFIRSITVQTNIGGSLDDVRQVRLAGVEPLAAAVPEPATWAMMVLGFAGVGFMARRRMRKAAALA